MVLGGIFLAAGGAPSTQDGSTTQWAPSPTAKVGASLVGGSLLRNQFLLEQISGFVLVVFGLAFMGLLPWPERLVGAGLVQGARSRGSRVLLGGAFAVCAAPCIGPVLAAILVLAGSSDTVLQGAALLAVYSLGLAIPFVLAGALFARAMGAFRWLRDHYRTIQFAGGLVMVALGLLLFFGRFYILRIYVNAELGAAHVVLYDVA